MKNLILAFAALLLFFNITQAQNVTEKKIFEGNIDAYSVYDFKYDSKTGGYAYSKFDTIKNKSKLYTNKGNSVDYTYTSSYSLVFDDKGNNYSTASNSINDTKFVYYFLKNGAELKSFESINEPIAKYNDGIYFVARENGKDFLLKYNTATGDFEYGKKYDTINYIYMKDQFAGEGEPFYELGFTKDGQPFYHACSEGKQFIVIGNSEMKKYDEIQHYNVLLDKNSVPTYIAKNLVNGNNEYFLVQGDKEYPKFTNVSMPIIFDNSNVPVYAASVAPGDYPTEQIVVRGSETISRKFSRGVYDILITPSGRIAYNGTDSAADGSYINTLVVDGKDIATYPAIFDIKFRNNGSPVFVASDKDNNSFVVEGSKIISEKYGYIFNLDFTKDGSIRYIGVNYGNYEQKIPDKYFFYTGKKKHGPFNDMIVGERYGDQVLLNENEEYAYISSTAKPGEYENTKFFVSTNNWKSSKYDAIYELHEFNGDFYYIASDYEPNNMQQLFRNKDKVGSKYEMISEFKFDREKGVITFNAAKQNKIYLVEVKL